LSSREYGDIRTPQIIFTDVHLKFKPTWDASCVTFNFNDFGSPLGGKKQEYFSP
jgi:hypothetical protein